MLGLWIVGLLLVLSASLFFWALVRVGQRADFPSVEARKRYLQALKDHEDEFLPPPQ